MQAQNIKPTQMHYACMVDLLGRAGLMEEAAELIEGLPIAPDANVWGALLGACRIHGNVELGSWAAEHLFKLKPEHCGYYILLSNMWCPVLCLASMIYPSTSDYGILCLDSCQLVAAIAFGKELVDHEKW
ncbi:hypothetical protein FNV43_RR03578 [Rhamnella rubrinervis]|uniref:Pentatricopeptide repeat-containing protein n=1 Tax=Rhamnella rubrinervis TaxID=2594499 RepID=A0A8K0MPF6_9ROSA|nr:hypothetical protein FNV43_RR03578 [Rhamnella rubrinervis]